MNAPAPPAHISITQEDQTLAGPGLTSPSEVTSRILPSSEDVREVSRPESICSPTDPDVCLTQQLLQPVESLGPSNLVEPVPFGRREHALSKAKLRLLAGVLESKGDNCLSVVGVRRIPPKGVDKTRGRLDQSELARQVEGITIWGLHRDPIPTANMRIELDALSGEALWPPPLAELRRVDECPVDDVARYAQGPLQTEYESLAHRHAIAIHRAHAARSRATAKPGFAAASSPYPGEWPSTSAAERKRAPIVAPNAE